MKRFDNSIIDWKNPSANICTDFVTLVCDWFCWCKQSLVEESNNEIYVKFIYLLAENFQN